MNAVGGVQLEAKDLNSVDWSFWTIRNLRQVCHGKRSVTVSAAEYTVVGDAPFDTHLHLELAAGRSSNGRSAHFTQNKIHEIELW